MLRKTLLGCGILAAVHYVAMNALVPLLWDGYSIAGQTVSELSAIDAPTRQVWLALIPLYGLAMLAFGWGVRSVAGDSRALRVAGSLLVVHSVLGFFWPPMHLREVIAAGGGTLTDTLHLAWTALMVPLMMVSMGVGAAALGRPFRVFTAAAMLLMLGTGVMTAIDGPHISANLPTPWIGVWERISIAAFDVWVAAFATALLRRTPAGAPAAGSWAASAPHEARRARVDDVEGRRRARPDVRPDSRPDGRSLRARASAPSSSRRRRGRS